MKRFTKFVPFVKIDEAKREVYGLVTAEVEDKDGETCHYKSTVPYYKAWSNELAKATDGDNLGNLREMHGLAAAGRGILLEFRDKAQQIFMGFKVVDEAAWTKVKEKVYTGFSHGGEMVKEWIENGVHYYTANPAEVSLVDNPCLPVAYFETVKANGTRSLCKRVGNAVTEAENFGEDVADVVLALNRRAVKAAKRVLVADSASNAVFVAKALQDGRITVHKAAELREMLDGVVAAVDLPVIQDAKAAGLEPSDKAKKAVRAALEKLTGDEDLVKSMYQVATFAGLIDSLAWLVTGTEYEREYEGDESEVPDDLRVCLEDLVGVFLEMADEETSELTAAGGEKRGMYMNTSTADLAKAASIHGHLKKAMAAHSRMTKAHEELGGHLQDCMKAMGHAADGDEADKGLTSEDLQKAITDALVKAGVIKAATTSTPSVEEAVVAALVKAGIVKAAEPARDPNAPATVADIEKTLAGMLKAVFGKEEPAATAAPAVGQAALPGVQAPVIPITKANDNGGVAAAAAAAESEFVPGADPRNGEFLKFSKTIKPTDPPSNVVAALPAHRA
jgi:hypothetical protein